ncbi:hypothetical protein QP157_18405 [Sphingomonas sp. LR61]|uniref:hypothetical protein n=1 Tax=Sphingomonas sp. LR61 TaxID=3050234 RepID=UPI002FE29F8F
MIASRWAASNGETSASRSCSSGVESADDSVKNTWLTRVSSCPERSRAMRVFSTVGACGSVAMASTSARCSAMPASKAGR